MVSVQMAKVIHRIMSMRCLLYTSIKNAYRDFVGGGILDEETMLKFVNAIGRDNARFPMHWDDSDNRCV